MKAEEKIEIDLWELENNIYDEGYELLCGVDEAGRGPLAGLVCAAAVILPRGVKISGLNDSKKLKEHQRNILYDIICNTALDYSIASASVEEIESLNILGATYLAMNRAIEGLSVCPTLALIDGNQSARIEHPCRCVIKGDAKCADIAAASILAKVTRDRHMIEASKRYPQYFFEKHKGYGTKLHYEALREHGSCEIHRISFLKNLN